MNRKLQSLARRIARIKGQLGELGDLRPGSLSMQRRKWGGQYYQLSYTHRGQGHTEYVPRDKRKLVEKQLANHRRLRQLLQEWIDLEIELCKLKLRQDSQD